MTRAAAADASTPTASVATPVPISAARNPLATCGTKFRSFSPVRPVNLSPACPARFSPVRPGHADARGRRPPWHRTCCGPAGLDGGSVTRMRTALAGVATPGLTRALASGYHGPPELTVTRALTEWTLDPWMLVLIVLLGGGYLAGVRRVRATTAWPVARPIWFCGLGLGFLVIATMSWVSVYQSVLLYPRAVPTVLLVLVVPLFLALGRPVTLFTAVFPRAGARVEAVIRSRVARIVTFPAITT